MTYWANTEKTISFSQTALNLRFVGKWCLSVFKNTEIKVKFSLFLNKQYVMKMYGGYGDVAQPLLISAVNGGE